MEEYLDILQKALCEPFIEVEEDFLDDYFKVIHTGNYQQVIKSHDVWNQAFDTIDKQYQIGRYEVHQTSIESHLKQMLSAIALINSQEQKWLVMPLIIHLDAQQMFFQFLNDKLFFNALKENLTGFLRAITVSTDLGNTSDLHWEAKSYRNYEVGITEGNIKKIYDFIQAIERGNGLIPDRFVVLCVFALYRTSFQQLVQILNNQNDVLTMVHLISGLSVSEKLNVASSSQNIILQFEILREVCYFQRDGCFSKEEEQFVANLIITLSNNDDIWVQFLDFYLEYPLRSPLLFKSLGIALDQLSEDKVMLFIASISIDCYVNNESKSALNDCFINISDERTQKLIATKVFKRWLSFVENYCEYCNGILMSNVIDIVMQYIIQYVPKRELVQLIKGCLYSIKELDNQWFKSPQEQTNQFYKYISQLFVYGIAIDKYELIEMKDEIKSILDGSLVIKYESNQNMKSTSALFDNILAIQ